MTAHKTQVQMCIGRTECTGRGDPFGVEAVRFSTQSMHIYSEWNGVLCYIFGPPTRGLIAKLIVETGKKNYDFWRFNALA